MKSLREGRVRGMRVLAAMRTAVVAVLAAAAWGGSAAADVSLIKTQDVMHQISEYHNNGKLTDNHPRTRSNAPEPSSLYLFGGGILGIMMSFIRRSYAAAKRMVDIVGSLAAMIILSPVCLVAAAIIKFTSTGPVIFKQIRMGKGGRHFNIYKFRTMKTDAEKDTGPVWAAQNDNRLIPIGNFLRKTHLDEIPQFINVLKGDMSIVGPRPERPFFVEKLKYEIHGYERRLMVKPGITGLAQVCHRADQSTKDVKIKVKYDLLYMKKMSMFADVVIICRTALMMLTASTAGNNRILTVR